LACECAKARQDDVVDSIFVARPKPSESGNGPVDRVEEAGLVKQGRDLVGQEGTKIVGSIPDFVDDLDSAIKEADDVLEVVAAEVIAASPSVPRLQLRRK
jgi:hypothetical protein